MGENVTRTVVVFWRPLFFISRHKDFRGGTQIAKQAGFYLAQGKCTLEISRQVITKLGFLCLLELPAHLLTCSPTGQFVPAHDLCIPLPVVVIGLSCSCLQPRVSLDFIRSSQSSGCQLMVMFKVLIAFFHQSPLLGLRLMFSFSYLSTCLCFNIYIFLFLSPHSAHV